MNLHGQIINMTADAGNASTDSTRIAYLEGHRDARHAAAKLALKTDACIDALRSLDARLRACMKDPISAAEAYDSFYQEIVSEALAALDGRVLVSG